MLYHISAHALIGFHVCWYDSFTINSVIQGYHIYKDGWDAPLGEVLYCELKKRNCSYHCAVAVKRATVPLKGNVALARNISSSIRILSLE